MAVESAAPIIRVQILSDLHIEFQGNTIPPLAPDAELIILAGDLAPVHTRRVGDLAKRWAGADKIVYVPGNHDTTARKSTLHGASSPGSACITA